MKTIKKSEPTKASSRARRLCEEALRGLRERGLSHGVSKSSIEGMIGVDNRLSWGSRFEKACEQGKLEEVRWLVNEPSWRAYQSPQMHGWKGWMNACALGQEAIMNWWVSSEYAAWEKEWAQRHKMHPMPLEKYREGICLAVVQEKTDWVRQTIMSPHLKEKLGEGWDDRHREGEVLFYLAVTTGNHELARWMVEGRDLKEWEGDRWRPVDLHGVHNRVVQGLYHAADREEWLKWLVLEVLESPDYKDQQWTRESLDSLRSEFREPVEALWQVVQNQKEWSDYWAARKSDHQRKENTEECDLLKPKRL